MAVVVFAHAGHWIANLLYMAPLIVLLAAVGVSKVRERRDREK